MSVGSITNYGYGYYPQVTSFTSNRKDYRGIEDFKPGIYDPAAEYNKTQKGKSLLTSLGLVALGAAAVLILPKAKGLIAKLKNKKVANQAMAAAEKINKPFSTSAQKIDDALGVGKSTVLKGKKARQEYVDFWENALAKKEHLAAAEKINKPFSTSAQKIDDALGVGKSTVLKDKKARQEYVDFWENALTKKEHLAAAEKINKPFSTSAQKIDDTLNVSNNTLKGKNRKNYKAFWNNVTNEQLANPLKRTDVVA